MRFTTKGDALYAIALAWPTDGKLTIKSLASGSPHYRGEIARIGLLGSESNLVWSRNADGLTINLPEKRAVRLRVRLQDQPRMKCSELD